MTAIRKKASRGLTIAFPDVCWLPMPPGGAGPGGVPIPYPSVAKTAIKSQQKTMGGSQQTTPMGTKTPAGGGVISSSGRGQYISGGFDVKVEGKNVLRTVDIMLLHNELNRLNTRLQSLATSDPDEWQKVLQEYVVTTSALYVTLNDDND